MALNCGIFNFLGARDGKRYWADCRLMLLLDFLDLQMWICTKYWGEVFFWHVFFCFFFFGFWLLASGSFGFWLLACICCILEPKSLICVLFAAVWRLFACPFGFWLLAPSVSGFWLVFAAFWSQNLWFACYLLQFGANLHAHLAFGFWLWLHLTLGFWFLLFFVALVSLGFWLLAALLLNVCVVL